MSKLIDVVKNDVFKKTVYDELVAKVNNIDTSDFVLIKTKYNTDKTELEKKIPDVTDFVKKANLIELENKIPDISNLATKASLTTVENKIPSVISLKLKINLIIIIMTNISILKILMLSCRVLTENLLKIKQKTCLLKMNWIS